MTCPPNQHIWKVAQTNVVNDSRRGHENDHGYIVPGLGDAGDRLYGTK